MKLGADAKATISELKKHGAEIVSTEIGGSGHLKIYYRRDGKVQFVTSASTGSDSYRGPQQARWRVRRALGITEENRTPALSGGFEPAKKTTRKRRKDKLTQLTAFTPGRDFFGVLRGSPLYAASLNYAADQAFAVFFGYYLRAAGHKIKCENIKKALDEADRRS